MFVPQSPKVMYLVKDQETGVLYGSPMGTIAEEEQIKSSAEKIASEKRIQGKKVDVVRMEKVS